MDDIEPEIKKPSNKKFERDPRGNSEKNVNKKQQGELSKRYKPSLFRNSPIVPVLDANKQVSRVKEPLFCDKLFKDMVNLHPHMVANLEQTLAITRVTAIQDKTIAELQSGKDALVRSQTGSGKTLAYAIPIVESLHRIRPKLTRKDGIKALIVLPTRELALQTYECLVKLIKPYTWLVPGIFVGGEKRKSEKARIRKGITILVCTPGRLLDHAKHTESVSFKTLKWFVIDEADRLLDLGYEKDITSLIQILDEKCEFERQTILLSATLTPAVERLAGLTLRNPVYVDVTPEAMSEIVSDDVLIIPDILKQYYIIAPPKLRLVALSALLLDICVYSNINGKVLVFMGTQAMVDYHTELLSTVLTNINFYKLHGNMTQVERTDVFKSFRSSANGILLCSDVAARGLDLPSVDWILQYNAPITASDYVHRVGRTARVGNEGSAALFLGPPESGFVTKLQDRCIQIKELKMDKFLNTLLKLDFHGAGSESVEFAASALQSRFETAVVDQEVLYSLGCQAYLSWTRFYASYPKDLRDVFNYKALHFGHYAKSFALRESPKVITNFGKPKKSKTRNGKTIGKLILSKNSSAAAGGKRKRSHSPVIAAQSSEFDSGLVWSTMTPKRTNKSIEWKQ